MMWGELPCFVSTDTCFLSTDTSLVKGTESFPEDHCTHYGISNLSLGRSG